MQVAQVPIEALHRLDAPLPCGLAEAAEHLCQSPAFFVVFQALQSLPSSSKLDFLKGAELVC